MSSAFFEACRKGDVDTVSRLLTNQPDLARATDSRAPHGGWTALHEAAKCGHIRIVRLLLANGADPNAREAGDNTYPLHWTAAHGSREIAEALLDAGGDVHGIGDVHELDVIGWATIFGESMDDARRELLAFLTERGAHHHIFSAICTGDVELVRREVTQNRNLLTRRLSKSEHGLTPLHFAIKRKRYDLLDLLIELGANLEGKDDSGSTALEIATMTGDEEAINRLRSAGAKQQPAIAPSDCAARLSELAVSVTKGIPMIYAPDVAKALDWYTALGFKEQARFAEDGLVNFGIVSFGGAELMLNMHGKPGKHDVSLWFYTDQVDAIYQLIKSRQIAGEFEQDIEDMFYAARQFAIRDLNGYVLYFIQELTPDNNLS